MDHQKVMEKLQTIFVELFDDESIVITDTTTANDIEAWDSLAHMVLISTAEEAFGIHFSLGEINNFANVGAMADSIVKHLGA